MHGVSILISHRDSGKAIELAIESIFALTDYPNFQIIVYDDCSTEESNLAYLRKANANGWIRLIEGHERLWHGGVLNYLVNDICKTPCAIIMDCDVQILKKDWLSRLIETAEADPKILAIVNYVEKDYVPWGFRCGSYAFWFGLLNMQAYQDGMRVDWRARTAKRDAEPFFTEFLDLYTPQLIREMYKGRWCAFGFDPYRVDCDPGSALYLKVKYDNPKGYKIIPLPQDMKDAYHHYQHISIFKTIGKPRGEMGKRHDRIEGELRKLKI